MHRQRAWRVRIAFFFMSCSLHYVCTADVLRSNRSVIATAYRPTSAESKLLDEVQRGCFNYFWYDVGSPSGLAKDRRLADFCSVAAVGFQLSALPIGVERGWVTREEAESRALAILDTLIRRRDNKKFGVYLHFVSLNDGGLNAEAPQVQASTVDHALLLSGAMTAASYFGGDVKARVDQIANATDWRSYLDAEKGLISFGWRPTDPSSMDGEGSFRPWVWKWASDEERLIYFLAAGCGNPAHAVEPELYYRLDRTLSEGQEPFVLSWNGGLFTYFFSHCWINYYRMSADDPTQFGQSGPRIDWFENSRRAVLSHRNSCLQKATDYKTFREGFWGLSACSGFRENGDATYLVPSVLPNHWNREDLCGGTVAPYAAGSSIIFAPRECLDALRAMRQLRIDDQNVWESPDDGGHGLADSFNIDTGRVSLDTIGIDAGPMLISIENYRTGLIWKLFHQHPVARRATHRLNLKKRARP